MRIGTVVQRSNFPASTIRYYERIGVLPQPKRQGGQRVYDDDILELLGAIQIAQNLKFSLDEIKVLMRGFRSGESPTDACRNLAEQKLHEVDRIIAEAQEMKRILEHGIHCDCTSLQGCYVQGDD